MHLAEIDSTRRINRSWCNPTALPDLGDTNHSGEVLCDQLTDSRATIAFDIPLSSDSNFEVLPGALNSELWALSSSGSELSNISGTVICCWCSSRPSSLSNFCRFSGGCNSKRRALTFASMSNNLFSFTKALSLDFDPMSGFAAAMFMIRSLLTRLPGGLRTLEKPRCKEGELSFGGTSPFAFPTPSCWASSCLSRGS